MNAGDNDGGIVRAVNRAEIGGVTVGADNDELLGALRLTAVDEHVDVARSGGRRDVGDLDLVVGNDFIRVGRRDSAIDIHAEGVRAMTAGCESIPQNIHQLQATRGQGRVNVGDNLGGKRPGGGEETKKRNGCEDTSEVHLNPLFKNSAFLPALALCRFPLKA